MTAPADQALALVVEAFGHAALYGQGWDHAQYESAARSLLAKLAALPSHVAVGAESAWWALVMGAAASLEDAATCLRDPDAKRAAALAAEHYRKAAKNLTEPPQPNAEGVG